MKKSIIGVTALLVGAAAGVLVTTTVPAVGKKVSNLIESAKNRFKKEKEEVAEELSE